MNFSTQNGKAFNICIYVTMSYAHIVSIPADSERSAKYKRHIRGYLIILSIAWK